MDLIITISRGFAVRNFYYKLIGLNWNKQKTEAIAGLQAILHLELQPHRQHLSVARASKSSIVPSIVVGVELLIGPCILPSYPQGHDMFMSPPVYSIYKRMHRGVKYCQGKAKFFYASSEQYINVPHNSWTRAIPAFWTPGLLPSTM